MRSASANLSSSSSSSSTETEGVIQKGRGIDADNNNDREITTGSSPAAIIQRRLRSFSLPRPRVAMPRPFSRGKRHENNHTDNDDLNNNNNNDELEDVGKSVTEAVKDLNSNYDKNRLSLFRSPNSRGKSTQEVGDDKDYNDYEENNIRRRGNSLRNSLSKRIGRRQNNVREEKEDVREIEEVEIGGVNRHATRIDDNSLEGSITQNRRHHLHNSRGHRERMYSFDDGMTSCRSGSEVLLVDSHHSISPLSQGERRNSLTDDYISPHMLNDDRGSRREQGGNNELRSSLTNSVTRSSRGRGRGSGGREGRGERRRPMSNGRLIRNNRAEGGRGPLPSWGGRSQLSPYENNDASLALVVRERTPSPNELRRGEYRPRPQNQRRRSNHRRCNSMRSSVRSRSVTPEIWIEIPNVQTENIDDDLSTLMKPEDWPKQRHVPHGSHSRPRYFHNENDLPRQSSSRTNMSNRQRESSIHLIRANSLSNSLEGGTPATEWSDLNTRTRSKANDLAALAQQISITSRRRISRPASTPRSPVSPKQRHIARITAQLDKSDRTRASRHSMVSVPNQSSFNKALQIGGGNRRTNNMTQRTGDDYEKVLQIIERTQGVKLKRVDRDAKMERNGRNIDKGGREQHVREHALHINSTQKQKNSRVNSHGSAYSLRDEQQSAPSHPQTMNSPPQHSPKRNASYPNYNDEGHMPKENHFNTDRSESKGNAVDDCSNSSSFYVQGYPKDDQDLVPPLQQGDTGNQSWMKYKTKDGENGNVSSGQSANSAVDIKESGRRKSKMFGRKKASTEEQIKGRPVKQMPFTDQFGEFGYYSGYVNDEKQPDGKGSIKYENGVFYEGMWTNGCQDKNAAAQYGKIRGGFSAWQGKGKGAIKSGNTMPWNVHRNDTHSGNEKTNVRGMEWTDLNGGSGRYTGEVDNDQLPHGSGIMKYDFGLIAEGDWVHGVLREGPMDRIISAAAMNGGGQSVMSGGSIGVSGHSMISSPAMSVGPGMSIGSNYMYQQGPGFPMASMHMMPMYSPAGSLQMGRGPQAMGHQMMPMHMPQMQMPPPQFMHPMQIQMMPQHMQMMPQHMQMNMQPHQQMQQHSPKPPVAEIKIAKNR